MISKICKFVLLMMAVFLILSSLYPEFKMLTSILGLVALASALFCMGKSSRAPVVFFLGISLVLAVLYHIPILKLAFGVNSMLPVVAIMAVMQLFIIPFKVGKYDEALRHFLQKRFQKESSLFLFLHIVTHLLSTILGFGTIPAMFSIFKDNIKHISCDNKRFMAAAIDRGFALSTFWAPGAMTVVLVLQITKAPWVDLLLPAVGLSILGIFTSVLLESRNWMKASQKESTLEPEKADGEATEMPDQKKAGSLILVMAALILLIVIMEQNHFLSNILRVLVAGLTVSLVWMLRFVMSPGLIPAAREYWEKSLNVVLDMAALFFSMGIFSEAVDYSGLTGYVQTILEGIVAFSGYYSLMLVPLILILLSLVGIHPFISLMIIGKILCTAITMPHAETFIGVSLLLGGGLAYIISPFAGAVLTVARLADSSAGEVAFRWNGLFSIVFLLEGLLVLFVMQLVWR